MIKNRDSLAALIDILARNAPAYVDMITAETPDEFESAFNAILEKAIIHLERNKTNFATLNEEGLTGVLAGALTMPGLTVTQETNSNGHVDLMIEADHCAPTRIKLAEAKIYSGPSYHIKGIGQLLGRYTTGRETQGLLITYVRQKNIHDITEKLRLEMDAQLPEDQVGPCENHSLKWSLVTKHNHKTSGEVVSLSHVGCNLFF